MTTEKRSRHVFSLEGDDGKIYLVSGEERLAALVVSDIEIRQDRFDMPSIEIRGFLLKGGKNDP